MTQRKVSTIPKAPAVRILMNAGAKRVSADAAEAFSDVMETAAREIAERASQIAKHSGRKTVNDEDIKMAVR